MKRKPPVQRQLGGVEAASPAITATRLSASTATRPSASTAPELALDGRFQLHAGIPHPPPPSWRWMGSFHFLPAFRVHRPQAGAGWAASTSCWHEQANQAGHIPLPADSSPPISMVYIDGLRVISLQRTTWGRTGSNPCLCLL